MTAKKNIFGCFFKIGFDPNLTESNFKKMAKDFKPYVWETNGVDNFLTKLDNFHYGKDLNLVLFQFHVKPTALEKQHIKEIESYRKKEKSIGIPIIVNDENFFNKSERERYDFIKGSIMQKMDLLEGVVKKKKLDTDMELLKKDLKAILEQWQHE